MPVGLTEKILDSLKEYAELKALFKAKFDALSFETRRDYNYPEMMKIKKYHNSDTFLEKAYLLGFKPGKKPYKGIANKSLTEQTQAGDYTELLFCFDDTMHFTITKQLNVPETTEDLLTNKDKWALKRRKKSMKSIYDYIRYLGE